jgi:orotidine-5'-phosphate decarboxylase
MNALQKLNNQNAKNKFVCIGLDTDETKIPHHLKSAKNSVLEFNKAIIDNTAEHAAAFKLNFAFYEKNGTKGFETLEETLSFIPKDILIIGDAKRGDIGNTSEMYASSVYNYFKCDASTIHPYMGEDSVLPFLKDESKLNFILALTSNPGANDFEKLKLEDGSFLFQQVIKKVKQWNTRNNCGIVFGATKLEELKENFTLFDTLPVLLPGVGAQGGSFEDVLALFRENNRKNFIVNISRGIIYKSTGKDFTDAAQNEILALNKKAVEIFNT